MKDAFTEGKTQEEWIQELYEAGAEADGDMPSWDEIRAQGVYKRALEPAIGLEAFRTDPETTRWQTPSGKIEIYSEQLAEIAATWELAERRGHQPHPRVHAGLPGLRQRDRRVSAVLRGLPPQEPHALLVRLHRGA